MKMYAGKAQSVSAAPILPDDCPVSTALIRTVAVLTRIVESVSSQFPYWFSEFVRYRGLADSVNAIDCDSYGVRKKLIRHCRSWFAQEELPIHAHSKPYGSRLSLRSAAWQTGADFAQAKSVTV
jgi:hypothetical protein